MAALRAEGRLRAEAAARWAALRADEARVNGAPAWRSQALGTPRRRGAAALSWHVD